MIMEHTGRYYEPVANVLHEAVFSVSTVNPLLIKEYDGNSLRKVKTDKADAMKIARYALDNWAELRDYTPMDTIRYDLKTLNRQFQLASKPSNNLIALLELSFPGIRRCFDSPVRKDVTQKWWISFIPSGTPTAFGNTAERPLPNDTVNGANSTAIFSNTRTLQRCMNAPNPSLCLLPGLR